MSKASDTFTSTLIPRVEKLSQENLKPCNDSITDLASRIDKYIASRPQIEEKRLAADQARAEVYAQSRRDTALEITRAKKEILESFQKEVSMFTIGTPSTAPLVAVTAPATTTNTNSS
jgi:hypothetical protein